MSKLLVLDMNKLLEDRAHLEADQMFAKVLELMEANGVCYCRFTRDDGVQIIDPRYNQRITGVIADA